MLNYQKKNIQKKRVKLMRGKTKYKINDFAIFLSLSQKQFSCGMTEAEEANNILKTGKLSEDDCVFILLHGNAKVHFIRYSKLLNFFSRTGELLIELLPIKNFNLWDVIL